MREEVREASANVSVDLYMVGTHSAEDTVHGMARNGPQEEPVAVEVQGIHCH